MYSKLEEIKLIQKNERDIEKDCTVKNERLIRNKKNHKTQVNHIVQPKLI